MHNSKKVEITPRERVLMSISHKQPDRVARSLGFGITLPAKHALAEYLGLKSIQEVNNYLQQYTDIRSIGPDYIGPVKTGKDSSGIITDVWGVKRSEITYGPGFYEEICYHPLKDVKDASELKNYQWPSPDWFNFDDIVEKIKVQNSDNEYAIIVGNGNIFESSWYMRGFEQMFVDLIVDPELANEIMKRVTDFFIEYFVRLLTAAKNRIDLVFTADDIGCQTGLLMSLDLWEKMIKPHHVRMNKVIHDFGTKIMYHTDGAVMAAVPGLIDMGIDILEALQFDAKGMDATILKEKYGDRLCFHGGISVQKTLPFGTKNEVIQEVHERINVLGKNGGYILAPSHAIQAGTPVENIIAFLKTN